MTLRAPTGTAPKFDLDRAAAEGLLDVAYCEVDTPVGRVVAARIHRQEEYIGATPAIAILPWFFAGALFPIAALPGALTTFAKFLPLTHALALVRYGLLGDSTGLHNIWKLHDTAGMASLSLLVVALFASALTLLSIRVFNRSAVQ